MHVFYQGLHGCLFGPTWENDQSKGNINFCLIFSAYGRYVWEPPMHFVTFHMELRDAGMRGALSCICHLLCGCRNANIDVDADVKVQMQMQTRMEK